MGGRWQAGALQLFVLFAFPCRSPKSALANFDTDSHADPNSYTYDNSNAYAYAATPIPDLSDTL
jgi:hypothetical protein